MGKKQQIDTNSYSITTSYLFTILQMQKEIMKLHVVLALQKGKL